MLGAAFKNLNENSVKKFDQTEICSEGVSA
jgi:hypothetical protein